MAKVRTSFPFTFRGRRGGLSVPSGDSRCIVSRRLAMVLLTVAAISGCLGGQWLKRKLLRATTAVGSLRSGLELEIPIGIASNDSCWVVKIPKLCHSLDFSPRQLSVDIVYRTFHWFQAPKVISSRQRISNCVKSTNNICIVDQMVTIYISANAKMPYQYTLDDSP